MGAAVTTPDRGRGCERPRKGFLTEPVSAVSSLAFVAGGAIVMRTAQVGASRLPYAALVAGIGLGSFVQHGPNPRWADLAHDLPLAGTLAFVAADAAADLTDAPRREWWWAGPTLALVPLIVAAPTKADLVQAGIAAAAVGLTLARARQRPQARRRTAWALGLLAVGGTVEVLSQDGMPLCDPDSALQGHAAWHVLSAAALAVLAPVIGARPRDQVGGQGLEPAIGLPPERTLRHRLQQRRQHPGPTDERHGVGAP